MSSQIQQKTRSFQGDVNFRGTSSTSIDIKLSQNFENYMIILARMEKLRGSDSLDPNVPCEHPCFSHAPALVQSTT